jgi:hypothetical protein
MYYHSVQFKKTHEGEKNAFWEGVDHRSGKLNKYSKYQIFKFTLGFLEVELRL